MLAGLQVFDQFGNVKLDLSDRIARYLGMVFTEIGTPGIITNEGLRTGTPFCTAHMVSPGGSSWPGNNLFPPEIIFSADTMYWGPANAPHRLMMWVY
jgi:hypothetical protein